MSSNTLAAPGQAAAVGGTPISRPAVVVDVEMSLPIQRIESRAASGARYRSAWLLVRVFGEAVGLVPIDFVDGSMDATGIVSAIDDECGETVRARVQEAGGNVADVLAGRGCHAPAEPAFLSNHKSVIEHGPEITVAICTRNRPIDLKRAVRSLNGQTYERFSVLVVDNAPDTDETETLVRTLAGSWNIRYAREERPGLSWARNRALELVRSPVVAWLDDDEIADENWLMELARAFTDIPGVAAVSGSVIPAELETEAQLWFELFGGHSKGRGFTPDIFGHPGDRRQSPLYPLPPFGVGANMAFDTDVLRSLGGFDTALGAGTASLGGEDTLTFTQILLGGGLIAYRPSALTRHFHRPDYSSLARQMRGYGIGLTAYYAALLRGNWRLVLPMVRLAPRALRDSFGAAGDGMAGVPASFPRELLRIKTKGMLAGPLAYARARRNARALARPAS